MVDLVFPVDPEQNSPLPADEGVVSAAIATTAAVEAKGARDDVVEIAGNVATDVTLIEQKRQQALGILDQVETAALQVSGTVEAVLDQVDEIAQNLTTAQGMVAQATEAATLTTANKTATEQARDQAISAKSDLTAARDTAVGAAGSATSVLGQVEALRNAVATDRAALEGALDSYRRRNLGPHANDAAANAYAVSIGVDPKPEGIQYENTTTDKVRVFRNGAWEDQDSSVAAQNQAAALSAIQAGAYQAQTQALKDSVNESKLLVDAGVVATAANKTAAQNAEAGAVGAKVQSEAARDTSIANAATATTKASEATNAASDAQASLSASQAIRVDLYPIFLGRFNGDAAANNVASTNGYASTDGLRYYNHVTGQYRVRSGGSWNDEVLPGVSALAAASSAAGAASSKTGAEAARDQAQAYAASAGASASIGVLSLPALRSLPGINNQSVTLLGYSGANDGGGNRSFYFVPATQKTATWFNGSGGATNVYLDTTDLVVGSDVTHNGVSIGKITAIPSSSAAIVDQQWSGGTMSGKTVAITPPDDGGMQISAFGGGQWVSQLPTAGLLNVLWFGAVRGSTTPATDSAAAFNSAVAWINKFPAIYPITLYAPRGLYRLNSTVSLGAVSLVGDGGNAQSSLSIHTSFGWFGEGFAISASQGARYENFYIYGLDTTKFQCGFNLIAGVQTSIKNMQIWNMTGIGWQLYLSSVGNPLFCQIENVSIINQDTVAGAVGLRSGASTLYNSNSNNYQNVFVKGKWKILYMIAGNGSVFTAGDCEPVNDTDTRVRHWYWFGGNANKVMTPYLEPSYPVLPSSAHEAKYKPIKFSGYWRVVEFLAIPTAGDTITLNGTTITFVASGASGNQCNIGASIQATIQNLEDAINGSSDANLLKLNAITLWREIMVDENDSGGLTNFTVSCTSANAAFRVPPGGVPFNGIWPGSSGNKIDGTNWATSLYTNTAAHIQDLGTSNEVIVSRINNFSPSPMGEKFSTRNLAPNSEFIHVYADAARGNLLVPSGYMITQYTAGVTMTRVSTSTPSGKGYALEVFVPEGGRFEIRFVPTYANLSGWGNGPQAIPIDVLKNKTITCGAFIKSSVKGLGAAQFIPGSSSYVGICAHTGSGEWQQCLMTGRVLNSPTAPQAIALVIANDSALIAATAAKSGTFWISEPVFMFGAHAPDVHQPLLLDDVEAAVTGRLILNAPQSLLDSARSNNSATPSVAEFNTFTEAYSSTVNITKFLNGRPGQEITIFTTSDNVTFVHNGAATADTIYTRSGANILAAANRAYKFVSNGVKWFETSDAPGRGRLVGDLPPAANCLPGIRLFVTDATSSTFGSLAVGGGTNKVPVWPDGSYWKIG